MNEKIGLFGAMATALLASACCIGPAVLAGIGIGTTAIAQRFGPYRPWLLASTVVFLGLGFYFAYRKPNDAACAAGDCKAPRAARWGRPLLWFATFIVGALVTFPYYYGPLRAAFDRPQQTDSAAILPAHLSTIEIKVSGMTCAGCAVSVRNALLETPGVAFASVDHEEGRATVRFDPTKASVAQLIEAVNKTGYKASL